MEMCFHCLRVWCRTDPDKTNVRTKLWLKRPHLCLYIFFIWFSFFKTLIRGENASKLTANLSPPPAPSHRLYATNQVFKEAPFTRPTPVFRRQGWWHYGSHQVRCDGKHGAHHMAGAAGPQWDDHPVRGQLQETRRHGGEDAHHPPDTSVALSFHYRSEGWWSGSQIHRFTVSSTHHSPPSNMCVCLKCRHSSSFIHHS